MVRIGADGLEDEDEEDGEGVEAAEPIRLADIEEDDVERISLGIPRVNWFVGGGWVPGCTYLLLGGPGVGKSTLWLQLLAGLKATSRACLGEEQKAAIKGRAVRLGLLKKLGKLSVVEERQIERALYGGKPAKVNVFDSIHKMTAEGARGVAGSISQVSAVYEEVEAYTKATNAVSILISQVNKDDEIKGARELEHAVDAVMKFELDDDFVRHLKVTKNRYGPTTDEDEEGITKPRVLKMRMTGKGLEVV